MQSKSNAKKAVIGACIALFANMGMNSVFTVFLPSFMATFNVGLEEISKLTLAITVGCAMSFICAAFLMGPIMKKLPPRMIFVLCAVFAVCYCGIYYFSKSPTWLVIGAVFGGLVLSLGTHAMGVAAITPYFGTFGAKTGITVGVVLASASVGATVFSFAPYLMTAFEGNWRPVFLVIGAVVVLCDLIAFFLIPKTPKQDAAAADAGAAAAEETPGLTFGQALATPSFWLVALGILFLTIMYQGLCAYMPTYLSSFEGPVANASSSMQGIMQFVGIAFVLFGGALVNKIGVKGLILFASVPLALGVLLYALVFPSLAVVWFAIVCSILCVSGAVILNICSTITPVLFGQKAMNRINGIYSGGIFWGGAAVQSLILGAVIAKAGFKGGFITAAAIGIVGMVLLFLALALNPMKKKA